MSQLGLGMTPDDLREPDRERERRRVNPAVVVALVALGAVIFLAGFLGVRAITADADFVGDGDGSVVVVVEKGDALRTIGATLADAGVVKSADAFTSAAADEPRSGSIAPGSYIMRTGMSGSAAVALMLDPASRDVAKVAVPEGLRMTQVVTVIATATGLPEDDILDSLARAGSLGLPRSAQGSPEGYLFPATYEFPRDVSADTVIETMIARTKQAERELELASRAKAMGLSAHEVMIVASLVQGESAIEDYPKVARVIYNRLAAGTKLQLDSTTNYGLGTSDLALTQDQLQSDTPYNTYVIDGLPPTPIGAPGDAALAAALNPAKGKWVYFISTDPAAGVTKFTADYDEFLQWKREYQAGSG
jgi:peptidoglycan lytic transglycosylase G